LQEQFRPKSTLLNLGIKKSSVLLLRVRPSVRLQGNQLYCFSSTSPRRVQGWCDECYNDTFHGTRQFVVFLALDMAGTTSFLLVVFGAWMESYFGMPPPACGMPQYSWSAPFPSPSFEFMLCRCSYKTIMLDPLRLLLRIGEA